MSEALAEHERALIDDADWIVGRFIVAASRVPELARSLDDEPSEFPVSIVIDGAPREALSALAHAASSNRRIAIRSIEIPFARIDGRTDDDRLSTLMPAFNAVQLAPPLEVYVEVGWNDDWRGQLDALHRARARGLDVRAKFRCGGTTAAAVANPADVAHAIWTSNRLELPFKATAGLHHPVRHRDASLGMHVHGFLNVIGGAVLARARGLDVATLQTLIETVDANAFMLDAVRFGWNGIGAGADEIAEARARFVRSYGSCSIAEPVADLRASGMLPAVAV